MCSDCADLQQKLDEANARALELTARVSYLCNVDTEDTMRNARNSLVRRITELEQQQEQEVWGCGASE